MTQVSKLKARTALTLLVMAMATACSSGAPGDSAGSSDRPYIPENGRHFSGNWSVNLDADRSLSMEIEGAYEVTSEARDAAAGKTEIFIRAGALLSYENESRDRSTDRTDFVVSLYVPSAACPFREPKNPLVHCAIELESFDTGSSDPGGKNDYVIDNYYPLGEVEEEDAEGIIDLFETNGTVVVTSKLSPEPQLFTLNESCDRNETKFVTYFSESPSIDGCSLLERP